MNTNSTHSSDRRSLRRSVVVGSVLASGAIAMTLGIGSAASADSPPFTIPGGFQSNPSDVTLPPGVTLVPGNPPNVTLPPGVTLVPGNPPNVTLPPGVTLVPTNPPTISLPPGVTLVPINPGSDDPGTADTTATPDANDPANTDVAAPGSDPAVGPVEPFLEITSAAIDCAGMVHVEYETAANPEPSATTEHVVVVSPVADPATLVTQRLMEQATNGQFVLDIPMAMAPQHIVIVADFEPANAAGIILVDEADVTPAADCPVTTG